MPLAAGTRFGPYEILAPIGAGGMGEVYRARDTKLGRDVAVKVLPESFAHDAERMARFEREAQVLASLNHPHIATIHGLEESNGVRALVMELVEGPTLAERIGDRAMVLDEALPIAKQIADGLEYAHERGIIHRDLKPANVKLTADGNVKILDFGLAKALEKPTPQGNPSISPTLTLEGTRAGVILGTAAYMAPEQARGAVVDKRADIWAFGVVLYEMLTGKQPFAGATVSDTLAAVLTREPEWDALPARMRTLVRQCLEKDSRQRLRDIGDARIVLNETGSRDVAPQPPRKQGWLFAVAAALAVAPLALLWLLLRAPAERVIKFSVNEPARASVGSFALSPDGLQLAFMATESGKTSLWTRPLDSLAAQALSGTDGADPNTIPFWSPDSRFIGFCAEGKLKKVAISGGPPQKLCDAATTRGATWNGEGVIIFTLGDFLYRISASGGSPLPLTTLDPIRKEDSHRWPWFLPDGRHYLYLVHASAPETSAIYLGTLDSKERSRLVDSESNAIYAPPSGSPLRKQPGLLLFLREGTLLAQPFDPGRAQLTGEPLPLIHHVARSAYVRGDWSNVSVSQTSMLAYRSTGSRAPSARLVWMDRGGKQTGLTQEGSDLPDLALSPDEKRIAMSRSDEQARITDIWLTELARNLSTRFTFSQAPAITAGPVWSPDGSRIAFTSISEGNIFLYVKASNGAGAPELLLKSEHVFDITDWSADGRFLLYSQYGPHAKRELWVLPLFGDRKPLPFLQTSGNNVQGFFSRNGRWIAYTSDEAGQLQVFVQPFPASGVKWQISSNGGSRPRWRRDDKELFYVSSDQRLMAVEVKSDGSTFDYTVPKALFPFGPFGEQYAVTRDGQRFLAFQVVEAASATITVVQDWRAELKR